MDSLIQKKNYHNSLYFRLSGVILITTAKFQEKEVPKLSILTKYLPECTNGTFKKLETEILKLLNWKLNIITPMHFVEIYTEIGVLFYYDCGYKSNLLERFKKYCEFFIDLCMQEHQFLNYYIESIALGCIAASRKVLGLIPWPEELENISNFSISMTCFKQIWNFYLRNFSLSQECDKENEKAF